MHITELLLLDFSGEIPRIKGQLACVESRDILDASDAGGDMLVAAGFTLVSTFHFENDAYLAGYFVFEFFGGYG